MGFGYRPGSVCTTFAEVSRKRVFKATCPDCGKKYQRTLTFSQTINPYNRNEHGQPKSRREIEIEIAGKAEAATLPPHGCTR